MFAIQLAKLAGYKVVSTSSPRNFELVKSFGADVVIDVSLVAVDLKNPLLIYDAVP